MPLDFSHAYVRRGSLEPHIPKEAKLSDLYKHSKSSNQDQFREQARQALTKAGLSASEIREIVSDNSTMPVSRLKEVAAKLAAAKIGNIKDHSVDDYLHDMAVKKRNIAYNMKINRLEDRQKELNPPASKKTKINRPKLQY